MIRLAELSRRLGTTDRWMLHLIAACLAAFVFSWEVVALMTR